MYVVVSPHFVEALQARTARQKTDEERNSSGALSKNFASDLREWPRNSSGEILTFSRAEMQTNLRVNCQLFSSDFNRN